MTAKARIIVCDDDTDLRETLAEFISLQGYAVDMAKDGAALRRLGVRFGAYHIFVPSLLKPGPAGLVTLLWALTNDGKDKTGFGDVVHALAAGRTSVVVDPAARASAIRRLRKGSVASQVLKSIRVIATSAGLVRLSSTTKSCHTPFSSSSRRPCTSTPLRRWPRIDSRS